MSEYDILNIKVNNLEKDMDNVKDDINKHREMYSQNLLILRENLVRLTILMEKQDEQLARQDLRLEKQEQALSNIGNEVTYLRHAIDSQKDNTADEDKKWYQSIVENYGKFLMTIILVLLCFVTGYKLDDIIGIIK